MTTTETRRNHGRGAARAPSLLWILFIVQLLCAVFFAADAVADFFGLEAETGLKDSDTFEYIVAAALFLGVLATGWLIREVTRRNALLTDQVRVASGEFSALLEEQFASWNLTAAERDVALLTIKGLSVAEIAGNRRKAP